MPRIAFCLREDAERKPGGDSIQIESTTKELIDLGGTVDVFKGMPSSPEAYDIIHLTNLDRPHEMLAIAEHLRETGWRGALLLSTIHHPNAWTARIPAFEETRRDIISFARRSQTLRSALNVQRVRAAMGDRFSMRSTIRIATQATHAAQVALLKCVDGCIALSEAEVQSLESDFGFRGPTWIVPNGVSQEFLRLAEDKPGMRNGIAVVGRIERRKNSLALLRTLARTDIPTVFIGRLNPNERAYCREFTRELQGFPNVRYLGALSRAEVARELSRRRLHVLASYAEVFPLVDLEALACGCAVLSTRYSLSAPLLDGFATIVDPCCLTPDIVREAHSRGASAGSSAYIRENFTWRKAARSLQGIYDTILSARHGTIRRTDVP